MGSELASIHFGFFLSSDLLTAFGQAIVPSIENESIIQMVARGMKSPNEKTRASARWAMRELRKRKGTLTASDGNNNGFVAFLVHHTEYSFH